MNHSKIYQEATRVKIQPDEEDNQAELVLDDTRKLTRDSWLNSKITTELIEFLENGIRVFTERSLEAANSATKPDDLLRVGRNAAKTNTYKEILKYVRTGQNPD